MFYLLIGFIALIVILGLMLFIQYKKINELSALLKDNRADPTRWTFADQSLIKAAESKADIIVSQAEVLALKMATEKVMESSLFEEQLKVKFEQSFEAVNLQLQNNFKGIEARLNISLLDAQKKHDQFLAQLEKQNVSWSTGVEDEMRSKLTNLLFDFEQKLTDFFAGAEQKSMDAINLEIKSARALIDSYKSQQINIIDENIIAVLERTLSLVLKEKLSLKDQLDMVYEALEKAKLEKFLA